MQERRQDSRGRGEDAVSKVELLITDFMRLTASGKPGNHLLSSLSMSYLVFLMRAISSSLKMLATDARFAKQRRLINESWGAISRRMQVETREQENVFRKRRKQTSSNARLSAT